MIGEATIAVFIIIMKRNDPEFMRELEKNTTNKSKMRKANDVLKNTKNSGNNNINSNQSSQ